MLLEITCIELNTRDFIFICQGLDFPSKAFNCAEKRRQCSKNDGLLMMPVMGEEPTDEKKLAQRNLINVQRNGDKYKHKLPK